MVKSLLIAVNEKLSCDDLGKLLLRLAVGGLMLFHGLHKLFGGVGFISGMLVEKGLPGFIAYGVAGWRSGGTDPDYCRALYASGRSGAGLYDDCGVADGGNG